MTDVLTHLPDRGLVVVAPVGDIDVESIASFRAALVRARELPGLLVIDLAGVAFMDSTGIGQLAVLVGGGEPRELVVANVRPIVRNALRLMGLDTRMTVHAYGEPPPYDVVTDTTGRQP